MNLRREESMICIFYETGAKCLSKILNQTFVYLTYSKGGHTRPKVLVMRSGSSVRTSIIEIDVKYDLLFATMHNRGLTVSGFKTSRICFERNKIIYDFKTSYGDL